MIWLFPRKGKEQANEVFWHQIWDYRIRCDASYVIAMVCVTNMNEDRWTTFKTNQRVLSVADHFIEIIVDTGFQSILKNGMNIYRLRFFSFQIEGHYCGTRYCPRYHKNENEQRTTTNIL